MTGRDAPHFRVRMDPEMKTWIEIQAKINRRSITGEIAYRLDIAREAAETATAGEFRKA